MIALNELVKNSEEFAKKYRLMGKRVKLSSIVLLEKKFTELQQKSNADRSNCNKLCSTVAELINQNKDVSELIAKINDLDKQINKDTKLINNLYRKINLKLSKLPGLARNENVLNIHIKTKASDFSIDDFTSKIINISPIEELSVSMNNYLQERESQVFDVQDLPKVIKYKNKISIFLTKDKVHGVYDDFVKALKDNSKILIQKSIKSMKKESAEEYRAVLSDKSIIDLRLIEEYKSREYGLKYHDSKTDMSKFLNQIDIYIFKK